MDDNNVILERGKPYLIRYFDHFEHEHANQLIITEVGFFLGQDDRYMYFASYGDTEGEYYNRTGIMKATIETIVKLTTERIIL